MPQKDYQAYALTPAGKAARARARAKWLQKRKEGVITPPRFDAKPLEAAINNWRTT